MAVATGTMIAMGAMAAASYKQAEDQRKEAERRERLNAELGANDTMFSPFVKTKSHKVAETDRGMGGFAAGLSGAAQGYQLGQSIQSADLKTNGYEGLSKNLGETVTAPGAPTMALNTTANPQMAMQNDPYGLAKMQRKPMGYNSINIRNA